MSMGCGSQHDCTYQPPCLYDVVEFKYGFETKMPVLIHL